MDDPTSIIDDQTPRRPLITRLDRALRWFGRAMVWFLLKRPVSLVESAVVPWAFVAIAYTAIVICTRDSLDRERLSLLAMCFFLTAAGASVVAGVRLIRRQNYHAIGRVLLTILIISVASGLVQLHRCPHASYLQVGGMSIAIAGDRCGNVQPTIPWWMRG